MTNYTDIWSRWAKRAPASWVIVCSYLDENASKGPYTLGTYLTRNLHGKAKSYLGDYEKTAKRILEDLMLSGVVIEVKSVGKRKAYQWRRR